MKNIIFRISALVFVSVFIFFGLLVNTSCVKEEDYLETSGSLAKLSFSVDTLKFDTVFTTLGSTTKQVKVYNYNDKPIMFSSVRLKSGASSRFRINVDGDTALIAHNVSIEAHDSMFIFVRVNVNPNSESSPFLIEDAIEFNVKDASKSLPLTAFGRNAIYHYPNHSFESGGEVYKYSVIDCSKDWDASKPHIIFGYAVVDEDSVLNIKEGAEIYFSNDACLWVYDGGTLNISGSVLNPVLLTSIRKDEHYKELPGQWQGIWLSSGSKDNVISAAVIENASVGVLVDTVANANPTLVINNTIIKNMSLAGLYGQGAVIEGDNLLIHNCRMATVALTLGGRYVFSNSTFANFWNYDSRKSASVILNNWYQDITGHIQLRPLVEASFNNCIIYGSLAEEISLDKNDGATFNYSFNYCLLRTKSDFVGDLIINKDPLFVNKDEGNYHLLLESPAIGAGSSVYVQNPYDLDNVIRQTPPTIGAYEYVEEVEENQKYRRR